MKLISFKVDNQDYDRIKKIVKEQKLNFTLLFKPIAHNIASGNAQPTKYTKGIPQNSDELYIYISQLKKIIDKIIKSCDFEKKKEL
ncbi:MAG: hypothetical protein MUO82_07740 [Candidatus Thermoplasmatota archaeon]|nr:hypothetical protein [Candidatus Thermoplasmatota archaeon]